MEAPSLFSQYRTSVSHMVLLPKTPTSPQNLLPLLVVVPATARLLFCAVKLTLQC